MKAYQSLQEGNLFIGAASDAEAMVSEEGCEVIVDLRAEALTPSVQGEGVAYIHIALADQTEDQEEKLKQAIEHVVEAYNDGKKVGFHCAGGRSRAGSVAVGVLVALGLADKLEDAEEKVRSVRPEVQVHPALKASLMKLANDPKAYIVNPNPVLGKTYTTVADIIRDRRTVWDFKPDPIPFETIVELLNVAVWAPTHGLREPWRFILIQGDRRNTFADAVIRTYSKDEKAKYEKQMTDYYTSIPYHLIVVMTEDPRQKQWEEDFSATSCLIHNLQLAAWEKGIGLVWKTNPYSYAPSFRETFGIQPGEKIVGVLQIGYPSKVYKPRRRTNAQEKLTIIGS